MSDARTSTIPVGSTMSPFGGPPLQLQLCRATFVCPVWATQSTASLIFTLPRAVRSWIQALRRTKAQCGAHGSVPRREQRPVVCDRIALLPGTPALSGAVDPPPCGAEGLHATQPRGLPPLGDVRGGCRDQLHVYNPSPREGGGRRGPGVPAL